jgi:rhodanese-related sulfurtransferase
MDRRTDAAMQQLTPHDLKAWLDDPARKRPVLLDVREPWEREICSLADSLHVPMNTVPARAGELDPSADTVVICHHGSRSFHVALYLERGGFARVYNLQGGIDGWARAIDPALRTY